MKVISKHEFDTVIENGVVIVDFFATWCGPCKMLSSVLEEVEVEVEGKAKIVKVDVDKSAELAQRYGIMAVPTMMIFKDGKVVKQLQGFMSKAQLVNEIETIL